MQNVHEDKVSFGGTPLRENVLDMLRRKARTSLNRWLPSVIPGDNERLNKPRRITTQEMKILPILKLAEKRDTEGSE